MATESTAERVSARERLLSAASELFYEEGVHTVGVDRLVERAGVAKATLYALFGNKNGLVRAYLTRTSRPHPRTHGPGTRGSLPHAPRTPPRGLRGPGPVVHRGRLPRLRLHRANAESSAGTSVEEVTEDYRNWVHSLFVGLAKEAGANDPQGLAQQLVLLYDGAGISAWMDHDPSAANTARTVAAALIDAAISEARTSVRGRSTPRTRAQSVRQAR